MNINIFVVFFLYCMQFISPVNLLPRLQINNLTKQSKFDTDFSKTNIFFFSFLYCSSTFMHRQRVVCWHEQRLRYLHEELNW